jgi:hypothetical protein
MRVAVIGAGGVGGAFGATLAAAGGDVTIVARGALLAAIRRSGLRIEGGRGETMINPAQVSTPTPRPSATGPLGQRVRADVLLYPRSPDASVKSGSVSTIGRRVRCGSTSAQPLRLISVSRRCSSIAYRSVIPAT